MARVGKLAKVLDRHVGIPLVAGLGLLRGSRPLPAEIRTIGLFKEACIGDTILLSGLVPDLRRAFPSARLLFFCGPTNRGAANLLGFDEVVEIPVTDPLGAVRGFRSVSLDVLLDFGQWTRINAVYSWFARARCTIGFRTAGQHRQGGYDLVVDHRDDVHELENFRNLLAPLGVRSTTPPRLPLGIPPADLSGLDYVVCHPWPGGTLSEVREWPAARWVELITRLAGEGMTVLVTGGPDDQERSRELVDAVGHPLVRSAAGRRPLQEICGLLAAARCVVSVNTGIMHMAALVGAPTVGLNGPTSETRWGAVGPRVVNLSVAPPHGGYLNLGFEYEGKPLDCMERIQVDQVWDAVHHLLEGVVADAPLHPA